MNSETVILKVSEICKAVKDLATGSGSSFYVKQSKQDEYTTRILAIPVIDKDSHTLEVEQNKMLVEIVEQIAKEAEEFVLKELHDHNKKLEDSMAQVREKIEVVANRADQISDEKKIIISKYKILLSSKGPTGEVQQELKKVEGILDKYKEDLKQMYDDQEALLIKQADTKRSLIL